MSKALDLEDGCGLQIPWLVPRGEHRQLFYGSPALEDACEVIGHQWTNCDGDPIPAGRDPPANRAGCEEQVLVRFTGRCVRRAVWWDRTEVELFPQLKTRLKKFAETNTVVIAAAKQRQQRSEILRAEQAAAAAASSSCSSRAPVLSDGVSMPPVEAVGAETAASAYAHAAEEHRKAVEGAAAGKDNSALSLQHVALLAANTVHAQRKAEHEAEKAEAKRRKRMERQRRKGVATSSIELPVSMGLCYPDTWEDIDAVLGHYVEPGHAEEKDASVSKASTTGERTTHHNKDTSKTKGVRAKHLPSSVGRTPDGLVHGLETDDPALDTNPEHCGNPVDGSKPVVWYLVSWKDLPAHRCTWEPASFLDEPGDLQAIAAYHRRKIGLAGRAGLALPWGQVPDSGAALAALPKQARAKAHGGAESLIPAPPADFFVRGSGPAGWEPDRVADIDERAVGRPVRSRDGPVFSPAGCVLHPKPQLLAAIAHARLRLEEEAIADEERAKREAAPVAAPAASESVSSSLSSSSNDLETAVGPPGTLSEAAANLLVLQTADPVVRGMRITRLSQLALAAPARQPLSARRMHAAAAAATAKAGPPKLQGASLLSLRDYQKRGLEFMLRLYRENRGTMLADEMGLGKTIQSLATLQTIAARGNRGPFLVVAPLSTLRQWQREALTWTDLDTVLYRGSPATRAIIRTHRLSALPGALARLGRSGSSRFVPKTAGGFDPESPPPGAELVLTSYEMLMVDSAFLTQIRWEALVVDEAHRLRNPASQLLRILSQSLRVRGQHTLLLTGTPLQNNIMELQCVMSFLEKGTGTAAAKRDSKKKREGADPPAAATASPSAAAAAAAAPSASAAATEPAQQVFSAKSFEERFGELTSASQVTELQSMLRPFMLRRVKDQVASSLPLKTEHIVDVELTYFQKQWYRALLDKNRDFLGGGMATGVDSLGTQRSLAASAAAAGRTSRQSRHRGGSGSSAAGASDGVPAPRLVNTVMQLRKCCDHPFLITGAEERILDQHLESDQATRARQRARALQRMLDASDESGNKVSQRHSDDEEHRERLAAQFEQLVRSSGKILFLDRMLPELRARGSKVLIFSQLTSMLTLLEEYCAVRGFPYERLDGGVSGEQREAAIKRFMRGHGDSKTGTKPSAKPDTDADTSDSTIRDSGSLPEARAAEAEQVQPFLFLLSTRAGGLGLNLQAADTVILFDSDWNPQNDLQAMARSHRIGQTRAVTVYRLLSKGTIEDLIFRRASKKLGMGKAVLGGAFSGEPEDAEPSADDNRAANAEASTNAKAKARGESDEARDGNDDDDDDDDGAGLGGAGRLGPAEIERLLREGSYRLLMEDDDEAKKSSLRYEESGVTAAVDEALRAKARDEEAGAARRKRQLAEQRAKQQAALKRASMMARAEAQGLVGLGDDDDSDVDGGQGAAAGDVAATSNGAPAGRSGDSRAGCTGVESAGKREREAADGVGSSGSSDRAKRVREGAEGESVTLMKERGEGWQDEDRIEVDFDAADFWERVLEKQGGTRCEKLKAKIDAAPGRPPHGGMLGDLALVVQGDEGQELMQAMTAGTLLHAAQTTIAKLTPMLAGATDSSTQAAIRQQIEEANAQENVQRAILQTAHADAANKRQEAFDALSETDKRAIVALTAASVQLMARMHASGLPHAARSELAAVYDGIVAQIQRCDPHAPVITLLAVPTLPALDAFTALGTDAAECAELARDQAAPADAEAMVAVLKVAAESPGLRPPRSDHLPALAEQALVRLRQTSPQLFAALPESLKPMLEARACLSAMREMLSSWAESIIKPKRRRKSRFDAAGMSAFVASSSEDEEEDEEEGVDEDDDQASSDDDDADGNGSDNKRTKSSSVQASAESGVVDLTESKGAADVRREQAARDAAAGRSAFARAASAGQGEGQDRAPSKQLAEVVARAQALAARMAAAVEGMTPRTALGQGRAVERLRETLARQLALTSGGLDVRGGGCPQARAAGFGAMAALSAVVRAPRSLTSALTQSLQPNLASPFAPPPGVAAVTDGEDPAAEAAALMAASATKAHSRGLIRIRIDALPLKLRFQPLYAVPGAAGTPESNPAAFDPLYAPVELSQYTSLKSAQLDVTAGRHLALPQGLLAQRCGMVRDRVFSGPAGISAMHAVPEPRAVGLRTRQVEDRPWALAIASVGEGSPVAGRVCVGCVLVAIGKRTALSMTPGEVVAAITSEALPLHLTFAMPPPSSSVWLQSLCAQVGASITLSQGMPLQLYRRMVGAGGAAPAPASPPSSSASNSASLPAAASGASSGRVPAPWGDTLESADLSWMPLGMGVVAARELEAASATKRTSKARAIVQLRAALQQLSHQVLSVMRRAATNRASSSAVELPLGAPWQDRRP